jgi:hypothetical protein
MKLFALIIAAFAALAPMKAYANAETCSNDDGSLVNIQVCGNDIL